MSILTAHWSLDISYWVVMWDLKFGLVVIVSY